MKVFFDNCTSPVLATTLHGLIQHDHHSAVHIRDLPCGRNASDVEWIGLLASDPALWVVITGDDRIHRNPPERQAYRSAGLRGFVLSPAYQKSPLHQCASTLIWRWPEMHGLLSMLGGPAMFELPIKRGTKIKTIPL